MSARVLITGGRTYSNTEFVYRTLDAINCDVGIERVIHGDALGADRLAKRWAESRGVTNDARPAQWGKIDGIPSSKMRRGKGGQLYNPLAGFDRNAAMLFEQPTHAIAFPGGNGTDDMCERIHSARKNGQPIKFIDMREIG